MFYPPGTSYLSKGDLKVIETFRVVLRQELHLQEIHFREVILEKTCKVTRVIQKLFPVKR